MEVYGTFLFAMSCNKCCRTICRIDIPLGPTGPAGPPGVGSTGPTGPAGGGGGGSANVNLTFFVDEVYGTAGGIPDSFNNPYQTIDQALAAYIASARGRGIIYVQPGDYVPTTSIAAAGLTYHFEPGSNVQVNPGITLFDVQAGFTFNIEGHGSFFVLANSSLMNLANTLPVIFEADNISSSSNLGAADIIVGAGSTLYLKVIGDVTCTTRYFIQNLGTVNANINNIDTSGGGAIVISGVPTICNMIINSVTHAGSQSAFACDGVIEINEFIETVVGARLAETNSNNLQLSIDRLSLNNPQISTPILITGGRFQYKGLEANFTSVNIPFYIQFGNADIEIENVVMDLTGALLPGIFVYNDTATTTVKVQSFVMTSSNGVAGTVLSLTNPIAHSSYFQSVLLNDINHRIISHINSNSTEVVYVFDQIRNSNYSTGGVAMININNPTLGSAHLSINNAIITTDNENFIDVSNTLLTYTFGNIDVTINNSDPSAKAALLSRQNSATNGTIDRMFCTSCCINNQSLSTADESSVYFGHLSSNTNPTIIKTAGNSFFSVKGGFIEMIGSSACFFLTTGGSVSIDVNQIVATVNNAIVIEPGISAAIIRFGYLFMSGDGASAAITCTADGCLVSVRGGYIRMNNSLAAIITQTADIGLNWQSSIDTIEVGNGHIWNLTDSPNVQGSYKFNCLAAFTPGRCIVTDTQPNTDVWLSGYYASTTNFVVEDTSLTPSTRFRIRGATLITAGANSVTSAVAMVFNTQCQTCSNKPMLAPALALTAVTFVVNAGFV